MNAEETRRTMGPDPEDVALAAILELERRWDAGARTLLALGFPWAEVALDFRQDGGRRRYGALYGYDIPGEIRTRSDRSNP
jgi:hypothetical protein